MPRLTDVNDLRVPTDLLSMILLKGHDVSQMNIGL